MASTKDLIKLIENMDESQLDALAGIALRMVSIPKTFNGKLSFELNVQYGAVCDMHVNQGEVVRVVRKKRRMVSAGI